MENNQLEGDTTPVSQPESPEIQTQPEVPVSAPIIETAPEGSTQPVSHRKRWLVIVSILLINIALGAGNVYVHTHPKAVADAQVTPVKTKTVSKTTSSAKSLASADVKTLHYTSKPLGIEFDYPVDWRVSSDAANTSINLTSAPFSFTDPTSLATAVNINLSITPASQQNSSYFSLLNDDDKIAADSDSLAYTNPTSGQRKQTNISFTSFSSTDTDIGMGFISGVYHYTKGATVGSQDYKKVDPQITFYLDPCANQQCEAFNAVNFTKNDWDTNPNFQQVKDLLASLRFQ